MCWTIDLFYVIINVMYQAFRSKHRNRFDIAMDMVYSYNESKNTEKYFGNCNRLHADAVISVEGTRRWRL